LDPIRLIGEKKGTKRSLLVDALGAPLSLIVSGANRHDVKLLDLTLDGIVVRRPKPSRRRPQHLCADKAYRGKPAATVMRRRGYTPHVRQIGDETPAKRRGHPARRWVWHHILPQACGGKTEPANLISLCDNDHYAVHDLMWWLAQGTAPADLAKPYTRAQLALATRGWREAVAAGTAGKMPKEA